MGMIFENVENRNPILAGGFHADVSAAMFQQPCAKTDQVRVQGGKGFGDVGCDVVLVGGCNGCDDCSLVHINAAANGIDDLHKDCLLSKKKQRQ
jgi:hypothetical protein